MKSNSAIHDAIDYLNELGKQEFATGGWDKVDRLNKIIGGLRAYVNNTPPCECIHPDICNFNDRCCKNEPQYADRV